MILEVSGMKIKIAVLLTVLTLAAFIQTNAVESKYKVTKLAFKGWIKGKVTHTNPKMEMPKLEIDREMKNCGSEPRTIEAISIAPDGGLRNSVVYLKSIAAGKPFDLPANPPILTQARCEFQPHVQVVHQMSSIKIVNEDGILHTVHAIQYEYGRRFVLYPNSIVYPARTLFNIAMVSTRKESFQQLGESGIVKFICDAGHYWMTAYMVVADHPYFAKVSDDGTYTIEDVPPGKYTLVSWHEYFGTQEQAITVKENQPVQADFTYSEEL